MEAATVTLDQGTFNKMFNLIVNLSERNLALQQALESVGIPQVEIAEPEEVKKNGK